MAIIRTFNEAVSNAINKEKNVYIALFGTENYDPILPIGQSSDFNCGGLANELEYLKSASEYTVQSFDLDIAEKGNLDILISTFLNLPRLHKFEEDTNYRQRFRSIVNAKTYPKRMTRGALLKAMQEFGLPSNQIQIIERFDDRPLYFEVRITGILDYTIPIFLNTPDKSHVNQGFLSGYGIGGLISYLGSIINRIKAAGVDFDVLFIQQDRKELLVNMKIGRIQMYKMIQAIIKLSSIITKNIDAMVS